MSESACKYTWILRASVKFLKCKDTSYPAFKTIVYVHCASRPLAHVEIVLKKRVVLPHLQQEFTVHTFVTGHVC